METFGISGVSGGNGVRVYRHSGDFSFRFIQIPVYEIPELFSHHLDPFVKVFLRISTFFHRTFTGQ